MTTDILDCQLLEVPDLGSSAEVIAETHRKIEQLVKDGWTIAGHTKDGNKFAIWTRPKKQKLWRVEKANNPLREAIIVAEDEENVQSQACVARLGYHYDEFIIREIDINDPANYGSLMSIG